MEEKTLYLPTEHNDRIVAFIGSPLGLLAAWLVLINTVTFLIFGVDKLLAKHPRFRQRVPEKNLLLLAVVGGSVGALLGMYLFRHKTLHRVFRVGVPGDPGRAAPAGGGHYPVLEFPAVILF